MDVLKRIELYSKNKRKKSDTYVLYLYRMR